MSSVDAEFVQALVTAAHGDLERVRALLDSHPELRDEPFPPTGETALAAAAHVGRRDIARLLLSRGATMTIHAAAMLGERDEVAAMLEADPALALASGAHGIPLMAHAGHGGDVEVAQLLYAHGARDGFEGALHAAARGGREAMVRWLLDHGLDTLDTPDFRGKTALELAKEQGHDGVVALLEAASRSSG